jgi:4-amino-4-deoxy-L-arabinose transferase-like glycosyltransferase
MINSFNKNIGYINAAILLLLIFILPKAIIWDEAWYMSCVNNIHNYGLNIQFLKWNPAAPMHAIIHYIFSPITHLHSPQIRILDFLMCVCISLLVYRMLKMDKANSNVGLNFSFLMFLLPSFYVLGFFAITEAPCLLFYAISLWFLTKYVASDKPNIAFMLLSGLFLGLAILTRQVFLVCLGPPSVMIFYKQFKNRFPAVALFIIGGLLLVAPVFYIWKGLVPLSSGFRDQGPELISIKFVFLSFGYAFFYFLAIMPIYMAEFMKKNWKILIVLAIGGMAGSSLIRDDNFVPMSGLLPHVFSKHVLDIISIAFFKLIGMVCLVSVYFLLYELYKNRKNYLQTFYALSMLAILVTPAMILDQFSSRYSMQIAPVLVMFAYSRVKPINEKMQFAINGVAIAINLISVVTFFI